MTFELPEWLSLGSLFSSVITLIGLMAAIIKLNAAKKQNQNTTANLLNLLTNIVKEISDFSQTIVAIQTVISKFESALVDIKLSITNQQTSNMNVATFVNDAFSMSNLSAENKAKLQAEFHKLFDNIDGGYQEKLILAKETAEKHLNEKVEELQKLQELLTATQFKLEQAQTKISKSRRIS